MNQDLFNLTLHDGLPVEREGKTIRYRQVTLRETNVADERQANRLAERIVTVGGAPKLLVSERDFTYALTMLHIERLACEGNVIPAALIDMELFGKLSSHDLGLIEERVYFIELAAAVRYGELTQEAFDKLFTGAATPGNDRPNPAPQPQGQASELGPSGPGLEPGPALLADYAGDAARGTPAGHGR